MDWVQLLSLLDKYTFSTVVAVVLTWLLVKAVKALYRDVILPGSASFISHVNTTAKANEEFAKSQTVQAAAMTTQATALTNQANTMSVMSEAMKRVACQHPISPPSHG